MKTSKDVNQLEAQYRTLAARLDAGKAGPREAALAQLAAIDREIAGRLSLTVDQVRAMRGTRSENRQEVGRLA